MRLIVALLGLVVVVGCSVEPTALDPILTTDTCACAKVGAGAAGPVCPPTHCGLRIVVDKASCQGKVEKVEVLIGDTLEKHTWTLGVPQLSCRGIAVGGTVVVHARADTPWKWQSEPLTCAKEQAGSTIEHILECKTN